MQYWATTKRERGAVLAEFPDCPGCQTFSSAGEDIREEAAEALDGWLEAALANGEAPSKPRVRAPRNAIAIQVPAPLARRLLVRWHATTPENSQR